MAQAEPRLKAIQFRLIATAADLSGDLGLQPTNLDGRAGILPTVPRLAGLGFQGDLPGDNGLERAPFTAAPIYNIQPPSALSGSRRSRSRSPRPALLVDTPLEPYHNVRRVMRFRTATCRKNSCLGWAGLPTRAAPALTSDITPACAPILAPCPMRICPAIATCPPT